MAATIVPRLVDALVAVARLGLPNATVLDGMGVTEEPGDFLMIGVDNPDADDDFADAADGRQKWAHTGPRVRDDAGTLTCAAFSWNGDGDQKAARDSVDAMASVVVDACIADPTLGITSMQWIEPMSSYNHSAAQAEYGAAWLLVFTLDYHARF